MSARIVRAMDIQIRNQITGKGEGKTMKDYLLELLNKPRTRKELARLTQLSDRSVRLELKDLTKKGHCIIHDAKTNTYKLTSNLEEMEAYLHTIDSYSTSLYLTYLPMRKMVAEAKGEKIVEVRKHFRRLGINVDDDQMRIDV